MKKIALLLLIVCLFLKVPEIYAYIEDGVLSNLPSVRANGLGEIAVVSAVEDPLAGFGNPAFLGLFATQNRCGYYQLCQPVDFKSSESYSAKGITVGYSFPQILPGENISIGLAYLNAWFNPSIGEVLALSKPLSGNKRRADRSQILNYFSAALGYKSGAEFYLGLAIKYYHEDNRHGDISYEAGDYGALIRLPIAKIFNRSFQKIHFTGKKYEILFTPSIHFSKLNLGFNYRIDYENESPMQARLGWSIETGFNYRYHGKQWQLIRWSPASEVNDVMVKGGYWWSSYNRKNHYRTKVFKDLILNKYNPGIIKNKGYEIELLELFYFQVGFYEEKYNLCKTSGFGLGITGLAKGLSLIPFFPEKSKNTFNFIATHFDIQYNYCKWKELSLWRPVAYEWKSLTILLR